ncbi:hypothetical protein LY90DRAFT_670110 [Neocallimastix californiae]|uniref:Uncharacterized protein n=1 Tax=Neocallimastix californiae TaxID=1754190 RepID=A0A1Y2D500_9FUNG|nr:hypothetical protein LY90DRAFT_670110 [Neocallimastix californiae]|eukprot:ORY54343.1 hypothetical protein LY90DRAFT_670110 [Neocallimastix californiae]
MNHHNVTSEDRYIKDLKSLIVNYNLYDIIDEEYYEWSCSINNNNNDNNNESIYYISPIYKFVIKNGKLLLKILITP